MAQRRRWAKLSALAASGSLEFETAQEALSPPRRRAGSSSSSEEEEEEVGIGRIITLYYRSFTLHQLH